MEIPEKRPHGLANPDHCQRCGARLRKGGGRLCKKPAEVNPQTGKRLRCRLHGGRTTGPKTAAKHGRYTKQVAAAKKQMRERLAALKDGNEAPR
jgi:hypothetical protein